MGAAQQFQPGQFIFREGEDGGDLFFIKEGIVEIVISSEGKFTTIAELKGGDILGLLTVITKEARTASARAKTVVTATQITSDQFNKLLGSCPEWLRTVIKDCTTRVRQMNEVFAKAKNEIAVLKTIQINKRYTGAQMASAIASFAPYIAKGMDGRKVVYVQEMLDRLETLLMRPLPEIHQIFDVLRNFGIVKVELEPEHKRKIVSLDNAIKATLFAQWSANLNRGASKKFINTNWSDKEKRMLSGLSKFAKHFEMDLKKECRLPVKQLQEALERVTQQPLDNDTLAKAEACELLKREIKDGDQKVVFIPIELSRALACYDTYKRLESIESVAPPPIEEEDPKKKTAQAAGAPGVKKAG